MLEDELLYPFEIIIEGVPVSLQAKPKSLSLWKERVRAVALHRQRETYELGFIDNRPVAVTIYCFPDGKMGGDVDNIIKPILDALKKIAYQDDTYVERVLVQKFEIEEDWKFVDPSDQLARALGLTPPFVYVRVDDDLSWRDL